MTKSRTDPFTAWNLAYKTNNTLVQGYTVNDLNELSCAQAGGNFTVSGAALGTMTSATVNGLTAQIHADGTFSKTGFTLTNGLNTFQAVAGDSYGRSSTNMASVNVNLSNCNYVYDLNGNLLADGTRCFAYDDENQLISVWETNVWRSDFAYDGMFRRRISRDFSWNGSSWVPINEIHYVYDGRLVVEERNSVNTPTVDYTRGLDLSGTLQGAGGIGGLLARSVKLPVASGAIQFGQTFANGYITDYYHSDGDGNITCLMGVRQAVDAKYLYDPYGNLLAQSGTMADANTCRFSSKEWSGNSGLYYYGMRFYDPNLQRWINRDPVQEWGGINLYAFISNVSINSVDAFGLCDHIPNMLGPMPKYDPYAPTMLRPSDSWPHPTPIVYPSPPPNNSLGNLGNLFPSPPSNHGLSDFAKAAGKGLWDNDPSLRNTLKQYGNNILDTVGLGAASENLGLGGNLPEMAEAGLVWMVWG
jgi:RHS repeat-associated protein